MEDFARQVVLEAARSADDPVLTALRHLGFREKGSRGRQRRLRFISPGPGFNIASFIDSLNYLLNKDKYKGDKLFISPSFNGVYVVTGAHYHGKNYGLELGVGSIILTITDEPKSNRK